jgi:hypothetical protein
MAVSISNLVSENSFAVFVSVEACFSGEGQDISSFGFVTEAEGVRCDYDVGIVCDFDC